MWIMTEWFVLLGFSAWLRAQVRCEQTCKRYSKDVECPELNLKYGTVCYEWSLKFLGIWKSSSATFACDSSHHLSREHKRLNCKKRCTFIRCTFSWDDLPPICDQLGPSDESTTSGSTIETSTHVAYDVASTTTTVTVKTENETMYTSSSHEYNYTEMKRMASDQPDPLYMKTVYLTVPLGLCAAVVLFLAVYLKYRRKQAKCGNDCAAEVLVQRAAVNRIYEETNVNSKLVTNASSSLNEITYYNANFNQTDEQDNLGNDEYDHIGVSSHGSLDPIHPQTSQNNRLEMCRLTDITHEQYDDDKYDTIYDESEVFSTQRQEILDSEMSNSIQASASGSSDYLHVINDTNTSKQSSEKDWPYYSNAEIETKK